MNIKLPSKSPNVKNPGFIRLKFKKLFSQNKRRFPIPVMISGRMKNDRITLNIKTVCRSYDSCISDAWPFHYNFCNVPIHTGCAMPTTYSLLTRLAKPAILDFTRNPSRRTFVKIGIHQCMHPYLIPVINWLYFFRIEHCVLHSFRLVNQSALLHNNPELRLIAAFKNFLILAHSTWSSLHTKKKSIVLLQSTSFNKFGRGWGIRTPGPMVPNHVRYQTALNPVLIKRYWYIIPPSQLIFKRTIRIIPPNNKIIYAILGFSPFCSNFWFYVVIRYAAEQQQTQITKKWIARFHKWWKLNEGKR